MAPGSVRCQANLRSANQPEERADIGDQQVRCLHRGEVAAPVELRPVHDVVFALGDPPDPGVAGEDGDAVNFSTIHASCAAGESCSPNARVCGRVAWIIA